MEDIFTYYREVEDSTAKLVEEILDQENNTDDEDEEENISGNSWSNLHDNEDKCKIITGFTPKEFLTLFDMVSDYIIGNDAKGRGRKTKIAKQDKLIMVLCYLKHYETVGNIGKHFSMSKTHMYVVLRDTIRIITPILYDVFVINIVNVTKETSSLEEGQNLPNAECIISSTFQEIWKPLGTHKEKDTMQKNVKCMV